MYIEYIVPSTNRTHKPKTAIRFRSHKWSWYNQ